MTKRWEPNAGWIGVDLDGTLAKGGNWKPGDPEHSIGEPVPAMLQRVRRWLKQGFDVRIFTARATRTHVPEMIPTIEAWCLKHLGRVLPITATKDYSLIEFWDDRAVRVEYNTGKRVR